MDSSHRLASLKSINPLSFSQYFKAIEASSSQSSSQSLNKEKVFKRYLHFGSLPKTAHLERKELYEYLEREYGTALLAGIALFRPRTNMQAYLNLLSHISENLGTFISPGSLVGELEQRGISIAKNTIVEYLRLSCKSELLYSAKRINLKTNTLLSRGEKYYLNDLGLKYFLERKVPKEEEREVLIENAIYLELNQRYKSVLVGKLGNHTIDFVCSGDTSSGCAKRHYYQIVSNPFDARAERDKIPPLLEIRDNHPKTLLTLEKTEADCVEGIRCEHVIDWLLA